MDIMDLELRVRSVLSKTGEDYYLTSYRGSFKRALRESLPLNDFAASYGWSSTKEQLDVIKEKFDIDYLLGSSLVSEEDKDVLNFFKFLERQMEALENGEISKADFENQILSK